MKKILIAILTICMLLIPIFGNAQYAIPIVQDADVIEWLEKISCRIEIPVEIIWRDLSFYKLEKGKKLTDSEIEDLNEDEQRWYEQGYIVQYGEWIGDSKDEKDERKQWALYGSGSVIFSGELPEALQSKEKEIIVLTSTYSAYSLYSDYSYSSPIQINEKGIYAETLVQTNYHVIQPLVDKLSLGSKSEPINVYEEIDIKTSIDPPTAKFVEGARPIAQKYVVLVDKEGNWYDWLATTNVASIEFTENQNYDIQATVVAYDKLLDVGILSIKNVAFQPYATFRGTECVVGEKVWIAHSPLAMTKSIDRGHVNQTHLDLGVGRDGLGWNDQVKLDIPSAPGSSGSGIFDENGFLVALFHGGLIYQLGWGYSFIEGGHLAHEGVSIYDWLNWKGFSYIFLNKNPHPEQPV